MVDATGDQKLRLSALLVVWCCHGEVDDGRQGFESLDYFDKWLLQIWLKLRRRLQNVGV